MSQGLSVGQFFQCDCGGFSEVKNSYASTYGWRRQRVCKECGKMWTTIEVVTAKGHKTHPPKPPIPVMQH